MLKSIIQPNQLIDEIFATFLNNLIMRRIVGKFY
jgi:hypothetical protein